VAGRAVIVSANCSDPNLDPFIVTAVGQPNHGALARLNPSGAFRYTPRRGFVGADSFRVQATDGVLSSTATVRITVVSGVPVLSALRLRPTAFAAATKGATITKTRPTGTTVSYTDSLPARTTFTVLRPAPGIRVGKRCVKAPVHAGKRHKGCTRLVKIGSFTHSDRAGTNRFHFSGRLQGHALKAGSYVLQVRPRGPSGQVGRMHKASFRIKP
jgi:hypothetical protein